MVEKDTSSYLKKIIIVLKKNIITFFLTLISIIIGGILFGIYSSYFKNNTQNLINNLDNTLKNIFTPSSFIKNPNYTKQLFDNSDPNNPITKGESGFLLRDFYIAGSSKSLVIRNLYNDYLNIDMIKTVLTYGSRVLEFDIYSSSPCANGIPVVATCDPTKSYLYTQIASFNYIEFDNVCQSVASYGFSGANSSDPLFIVLNLHINKRPQIIREFLCNQMAAIIRKRFKGRLLGVDYSYQRTVIGNIPIEILFGKIIILSSSGFQGTELDEFVNYSWNGRSLIAKDSKSPNSFYHMTYQQLKNLGSGGTEEIKILNKKSMTLIVPDNNKLKVANYPVDFALQLGCNFICINYNLGTKIDTNYQNLFKNYSLVLKPLSLRFISPTITYNSCQNPEFSQVPRQIQANDPQFAEGLHI